LSELLVSKSNLFRDEFDCALELCINPRTPLSPIEIDTQIGQQEEELIETASELWPPALRQRLASALDHHDADAHDLRRSAAGSLSVNSFESGI
jgi:hypothetical protein